VASQLTAVGRGAISTVWVHGPRALEVVDRFFQAASRQRLPDTPVARVSYGAWRHEHGSEDVVVVRLDFDTLEIHTHGGWLAPRSVLHALCEAGVREVDQETVLQQTRSNPWQAAALAATQQALTLSAANCLIVNAERLLVGEIDELAALASDPYADQETVRRLEQLRDSYAYGARLIGGWSIAIAGRPNVGKSSLINRLVGFSRSIVFDQPGTTRDLIHQVTAIGGWPVQLSDTAGVRATSDFVEQMGVQSAERAARAADLTIWISDLSQPWSNEDQTAIDALPNVLLVHNKSDLVRAEGLRPPGINVSLVRDPSVDTILAAVAKRLFSEMPAEGRPFLVREWQMEAVVAAAAQLKRGNRAAAVEMLRRPAHDRSTIDG
jgi:tRNA modification GTPase